MASKFKTPLGFNRWVLDDKPRMEDFNADNQLVDGLITDLQENKVTGYNLQWGAKTFYIRANGNDTTGNGNTDKAFKTFGRAAQEAKKYLNGRIRFLFGEGEYTISETIHFLGSQGIFMDSEAADKNLVKINTEGFVFYSNSAYIRNLTFNLTRADGTLIQAESGAGINIYDCILNNVASGITKGIMTSSGSIRAATNSINNFERAMYAADAGIIASADNSGTGNNYAFLAITGKIINRGTQPGATTSKLISGNGEITGVV